MEKHVYTPYHIVGVIVMLAIDLTLFGWMGLIMWPIQMIWVPFWAAGIVNGVGHYLGYRNGISKDESRNIVPIGILVSGEELHNNHHLHPSNPKLSLKWWEFDIGWMYIKIFAFFHLLTIGKLAA
jgi:stearoyl-CoA desaturase (delta-9 desaturase)